MSHTVFNTPDFVQALLDLDPMEAQLLSILDAAISFEARAKHHFDKGRVLPESGLLNNPLLLHGKSLDEVLSDEAKETLTVMVRDLRCTSPHVQKFLTLFEKGQTRPGIGVLPPQPHITDGPMMRRPTGAILPDKDPTLPSTDPIPKILLEACQEVQLPATRPNRNQVFIPGQVTDRQTNQDLDVLTDGKGLPINPKDRDKDDERTTAVDLGLELALFVALFPHGRGYFEGPHLTKYLQ